MRALRTFSQRPYVGPPGTTEILLIRHAVSSDSLEGAAFELVEGQGDPSLSETGHHQAELLARRLSQEAFDGLYVSPLRRSGETAGPLSARSGMTPVVEPDLREVFLGSWEGGGLGERTAAHPGGHVRGYNDTAHLGG